jgi:prepilin-type N-terminal cleavage/methylation domain-containing protein
MHNEKGFTLIELIAVLVIMGVLTAVAVPKYIDLQASAERKLILMVLADFDAQEHMSYLNHMMSGDEGTYISPIIVPSTLSSGISLKPGGGDDSILLFTGGGEYDVYRCPTAYAAMWGQEECPTEDPVCDDGWHWDEKKAKCKKDHGHGRR